MTRPIPRRRPAALAACLALLMLTAGACSSPVDPTPPPALPTVTCPADASAVSNDGNPVPVTYTVPTAVGGATPVAVVCAPPSGSSFKPGSTAVTCTATDVLSRTATCGFSVKVSVPPHLAATKFMAFGDSMTSGKAGSLYAFAVEDYPGSYPNDLYSALVARYAGQSFVMSKQGWPGETTVTAVTRLQSTLPSVKPEVVLLMDGANDLFGGDPTAIPPAAANMRQMVLMSKSAGARVFLANLPPQVKGGSRAGGWWLVDTYNSEIAKVARDTATPLVDVNTVLKADPATYIDVDGLHPTKAGYLKIAETFFAAIQSTMETPGTTPAGTAGPFGTRIVDDPALTTQHSAHSAPGTQHSAPGAISSIQGRRRQRDR